jgi:glycosyltransferase involved in cell wall biosynthesis
VARSGEVGRSGPVTTPQDVVHASGAAAFLSNGVAFLCHAYHRGGVTRWMVDAAAELRKRGVPVWFVVPEPRTPFASGAGRPTVASLIRELEPEHQPTLLTRSVGLPFELGTHGYRTAVYADAIVGGVPAGTPCIVSDDPDVWAAASSIRDAYPMIGILHADEAKYYALARAYGSELAACIAVSRRIAAAAAREAGISVEAIPCGVPMRPLPDAAQRDHRARVVWAGRIEEEQKRVSDLVRIATALRIQDVPFTLQVIGDGPERLRLEREIEALGLQDQVELLGWMDADGIWARFCDSDVLILPSNFEGMPVVVMEALSAGCAVVASRVSGVEDVTEDELGSRVLFTHAIGDADCAASLISRAMAIPVAVRRSAARAAAAKLFSIEVCVDRYQEILPRARAMTAASDAPSRRTFTLLSGALSFPLAMARSARRALRQ